MRRPSLLKSKSTTPGQPQVVEFALDPAVTVESGTDANQIDEIPPEGGYGCVVCGAVSLINGFTWGVAAVRLYPPPISTTKYHTVPVSTTMKFTGLAYLVAAGFLFELWRVKRVERLDRGGELGRLGEWMYRYRP